MRTSNENTNFFQNFFSSIKNFFTDSSNIEKEQNSDFQKLVVDSGFGVESYIVTTEDGYRLQLYRITSNTNKTSDDRKFTSNRAIFLQHGLMDSSDAWVCNYPKYCLPYIFSNRGFDVWVGNSRGNKYSKMVEISESEDSSKVSQPEFWNFSFHEMGMYDTPAFFQKIIEINPSIEKIIYIGHSQGGASILAGMCEKLDFYKEKLSAVILLAPASRVDNHDCSLLTIMQELNIDKTLERNNIYEILPYQPEMKNLSMKLSKYYPTLSHAMFEMVTDEDSLVICPNRLKIYTSHYPSGTSLKSLLHFKQIVEAKVFQHYDYGNEENMKRYGKSTPKEYDLSSIKSIPIILCGGMKDKLTHIKDIRWLKNELSKTDSLFYYHEFEYMGHASFLLNNDITWFNKILRDLYRILENEK